MKTRIAWVLAAALVLAGCSSESRATKGPDSAEQQARIAVVVVKSGSLRTQPAADAASTAVARGTEFAVTGDAPGWFKVSAEGGERWLAESEVGLRVNRGGGCIELSAARALESGAIEGGFSGRGGSAGYSLALQARGILESPVCPVLERGMLLKNRNTRAQDMVAGERRGVLSEGRVLFVNYLRFEPGIATQYVFESYGMNLAKDDPSPSDSLLPAELAAEEVRKLLAVKTDAMRSTQLALWAVTDNLSDADAKTKFAATDAEIEVARRIAQSAALDLARYRLFAQAQPAPQP